jgi:hypothetical protein
MEENTLLKCDTKRNVEILVPEASAAQKRGRRRMSITTFRKNIDSLRTELPKKNDEHQLYRQISSLTGPITQLKHQVEDAEVWKSISNTKSKLVDIITGRGRCVWMYIVLLCCNIVWYDVDNVLCCDMAQIGGVRAEQMVD